MVSTVLATLCCCPFGLLGIIGIVNSTKVDKLLAAGDLAGAKKASDDAKLWSIIATVLFGLGLVGQIIYFIVLGAAGYQEILSGGL